MPTLSTPELTRLSDTLARALSTDEVNQIGRDPGQAERLRTVTPHRLLLALVSTLGSGRVTDGSTQDCNHPLQGPMTGVFHRGSKG